MTHQLWSFPQGAPMCPTHSHSPSRDSSWNSSHWVVHALHSSQPGCVVVVHFCLHLKALDICCCGRCRDRHRQAFDVRNLRRWSLFSVHASVSCSPTLSKAALLHWGLLEAKCEAPFLPRTISWRDRNYDSLGSVGASCKTEMVTAQASCLRKHMFSLCFLFRNELDISWVCN